VFRLVVRTGPWLRPPTRPTSGMPARPLLLLPTTTSPSSSPTPTPTPGLRLARPSQSFPSVPISLQSTPPMAALPTRATARLLSLAQPAPTRVRACPDTNACRRTMARPSLARRRCPSHAPTPTFRGSMRPWPSTTATRPAPAMATLRRSILLPRRPSPTPARALLIRCTTALLIMASTGMAQPPSLIPTPYAARCSNTTLTNPTSSSRRAFPCRPNTPRQSLAMSPQYPSMTRTKKNR
jgi:hypothetical protein